MKLDNTARGIELRFGPTLRKAAKLAYSVPELIETGIADHVELDQLQDAVNVFCGLLPDSVTVMKSEYRLCQAIPTVHRLLSALDHCTPYPSQYCSKCSLPFRQQ